MFTKEKLEKWIEELKESIEIVYLYNMYEDERIDALNDLLHTLEQLHTSITSDGSI